MNAVSEDSTAFLYHLLLTGCSLEEEPTHQQRAAEQHIDQPSLLQLHGDRAAGIEGTGNVQRLPVPLFIIFAMDCLDLFISDLASFLPSPLSISVQTAKQHLVVLLHICIGLHWEAALLLIGARGQLACEA